MARQLKRQPEPERVAVRSQHMANGACCQAPSPPGYWRKPNGAAPVTI